MAHTGAHIFRGAGFAARARPWPGEPTIAHLVVVDHGLDVPAALLRTWLNELRADGYSAVRSGAVSRTARVSYEAIGFVPVQTLALLRASLDTRLARPSVTSGVRLRRGTGNDLEQLARLDTLAFDAGWGLDAVAINDAMSATPSHRLRVAVDTRSDAMIGYAVAGRAGKSSFLQRLAVAPAMQGRGVGAALVGDAQAWAKRWRTVTMTVNTQVDNQPALHLYQAKRFVLLSEQLTVLQRILDDDV